MTENASLDKTESENKTTIPPQIEQKEPEKQDDKQENPDWRAFREGRKKDRDERLAAERRAEEKEREIQALKAAMEASFSKSGPTPQAYQQHYGLDQTGELSEEQMLEKKLEQLMDAREKKARQLQAQKELQEFPNKLRKDFPDFDQVCSHENLDYMDYHFPEVARPLDRLSEGYDKWYDIYHAVKKFIPNHSNGKRDAQAMQNNSNKPKSMATSTVTQDGQGVHRESWQETEQRRQANWQRMQRLLKGV